MLAWVADAQASLVWLKPVRSWGSLWSLQRWQQTGELQSDRRSRHQLMPANKLGEHARQNVLQIANSTEFAALPPSRIVPILAQRGQYLTSESTFYRILRDAQ